LPLNNFLKNWGNSASPVMGTQAGSNCDERHMRAKCQEKDAEIAAITLLQSLWNWGPKGDHFDNFHVCHDKVWPKVGQDGERAHGQF